MTILYTCTPNANPSRFGGNKTVWGSNIPLTGYGEYIWRLEVDMSTSETHYAMRCNHSSPNQWGRMIVDGVVQYSFTTDLIKSVELVAQTKGVLTELEHVVTAAPTQEEWEYKPHQYSVYKQECYYTRNRVETTLLFRNELSTHKTLSKLVSSYVEPDLSGGSLGYTYVWDDLPELGYYKAVEI